MHATPLQTIKWTWKDNLRKGMEYTQRPWPGLGISSMGLAPDTAMLDIHCYTIVRQLDVTHT